MMGLTEKKKNLNTIYKQDHCTFGIYFLCTESMDTGDNDDSFGFNNASTHEGELCQNGILAWFCNETAIMIW